MNEAQKKKRSAEVRARSRPFQRAQAASRDAERAGHIATTTAKGIPLQTSALTDKRGNIRQR